jgi:hypothetical protein
MNGNRAWRVLSFLSAALCAATTASADDFSQYHFKKSADTQNGASVPGTAVATPNPVCGAQNLQVGGTFDLHTSQGPSGVKFCKDMATCKAYCCWACDFHDEKVTRDAKGKRTSKYDGSSSCQRSPQDGDGIIAPNDTKLVDLGTALRDIKVLTGYSGKFATQTVADSLQKLDTFLDGWDKRKAPPFKDAPFTVAVNNCYRRAIGNETRPVASDGNAEEVCTRVFETMRNENKPESTPESNANDEAAINGTVWGLAWPGANPHSSGAACDIQLVDSKGHACFGATAGETKDSPCSIDQELAVNLMNEAVTAVGGWRLDYEAWHFEWGGKTGQGSCRCQGTQCDAIWPVNYSAGCNH